MTETLDVHVASDAERIQAYRNVHEFWGRGVQLEDYVHSRLDSAKHNKATWFVGCVDGRVVTSLGCYPVEFRLHGQALAGIALGSVHTLPDSRRKGFAPQLIQFVESHQRRERGARLSLLYSDIQPSYYARLGYQECPSWAGWLHVGSIAQPPDQGRISRLDASDSQADLRELYGDYHATLSMSIARGADYWDHLLEREPADEFYRLSDSAGEHCGYVRVRRADKAIIVRDYALTSHSDRTIEKFCNGLTLMAVEHSAERIGGWLPDLPGIHNTFDVTQRQREITMIKPLAEAVQLDAPAIEAAQYFHEIDHV